MASIQEIERIQALTKEEIIELVETCTSTKHIIDQLDIHFTDMSRKLILNKIKKYGLKVPRGHRTVYSLDDLAQAVPKADCYSDLCRILNVTLCTYNIARLQHLCKDNNLDTSHFQQRNTKCYKERNNIKYNNDIATVLISNSTFNRSHLRRFMIRKGLYTGNCALCGISDNWNNKPLTLELDHINGVCTDNRIENLRWVCPNCHSQTPTFKKGSVSQIDCHKDQKLIDLYTHVLTVQQLQNKAKEVAKKEYLEQQAKREQHTEENLKVTIVTSIPQRGKVNWDDVDVAALVAEHKNYEKVGRLLGVTGAAVKRQLLKNHE